MTLGARLLTKRTLAGKTQTQVAKELGLSVVHYGNIEREKVKSLGMATVNKLANYLGKKPAYIIEHLHYEK